MNFLPKDTNGCPFLLLAPMEGVGDAPFRKAIASIGGFDEAIKDFLRVPKNAHIKSLAKVYIANEIAPIPLAAQIMGSDVELMAQMAIELENRGALHIDLNFGCPSKIVNGRGSGASLLKNPAILEKIAKRVVEAVSIPVSIKMRSGYHDISLFKENLLAAEGSGVKYITLHPRTKVQEYDSSANWALIAEAKSILKIPVVGNGDIFSLNDALRMLKDTGCDGLMIGRGALINPFIFNQIKSHFSKKEYKSFFCDLVKYLEKYICELADDIQMRTKINKLKQIMSFLFQGNEILLKNRMAVLSYKGTELQELMDLAIPFLKEGFEKC
ncbi:MAG: tRNA-dihydrouridine synthase family protein [Chlamydiae bacterium]|nr:tRNA-dihydrouridine synthase family protein [Chlamydiota bacterium]